MTQLTASDSPAATESKPPGKPCDSGLFKRSFQNFCRIQVFKLLNLMQHGSLRLTMPDGTVYVFGKGKSAEQNRPEINAEITIKDNEFFERVLLFSDIGLSEAYIEGLWETASIRNVISWFLLNFDGSAVLNESAAQSKLLNMLGVINKVIHAGRSNNIHNSKSNIQAHYDLGNEFFKLFLDKSMTYSSALFSPEDRAAEPALYTAQQKKYARLAEKLKLKCSDHVLEIGCGWGGFSLYAAKTFGCRVTAITISEEQLKYVSELIKRENLSDLIDLRLTDYRLMNGQFDKIASIEMIEAVGEEHMNTFFACCDRLLKQNGLLGMQMITSPDCRYDVLKKNVDFIQKHIFPGSLLPSLRRVNEAMKKCGDLFLYDLYDMGPSYVETLRQWELSFNENRQQVIKLGFDESFIRKWNYYFEYCQAAFDMRNITVVQAVYTRPNNWNLRA